MITTKIDKSNDREAEAEIQPLIRHESSLDDLDYPDPYITGYAVILTFTYSEQGKEAEEEIRRLGLVSDWLDLHELIESECKSVAETRSSREIGTVGVAQIKSIEFIDTSLALTRKKARLISEDV